MTIDAYAYEEAQLSIELEREPAEHESLLDSTRRALSAASALCAGWLEPLVWELSIVCHDNELLCSDLSHLPPRPDWVLFREQIPAGVEARLLHVDPVIRAVPVFTSEHTHAWITEALRQECSGAPRFVPSWSRLWSRAMQAALPDPRRFTSHQTLQLDCYAGPLSVALERKGGEVFVSGPLEAYVIGPPVALTLGNDDGFLTIGLELYWSIWIRDPAGRAQVEAAVERVLALGRGWRRSED